MSATFYCVAKLVDILHHVFKGLLLLAGNQIKSKGEHGHQKNETHSKAQFKTKALPNGPQKFKASINTF